MHKHIIAILLTLTLIACGSKDKPQGGTPKLTVTPAIIEVPATRHNSGTWTSFQVLVVTSNTSNAVDTAVAGNVKVIYSNQYLKIYDKNGNLVQPAGQITTGSDGSHSLRFDCYSQSTPQNLEYTAIVTLQYSTTQATVTVKGQKATAGTITLQTSPNTITAESPLDDTGTWHSVAITNMLLEDFEPIQDDLFAFVSDTRYINLTDTTGQPITATTIATQDDGSTTLLLRYYTEQGLTYHSSVQFFYGTISSTLAVNITAEEPKVYATTITPADLTFNATSQDNGTWRQQPFTISVKENGVPSPNTPITVSVSSSYTSLIYNGTETSTYTATTDSAGNHIATLKFYTQSSPTKVQYTATLTAGEAVVPITVTSDGPLHISTNAAPTSLQYTAPGDDTGTWRDQYFTVTTTDANGNFIGDQTVNLAVSSPYTYLFINGQQHTSAVVQTNSSGVYNVLMRYFTQASPTKLTYSSSFIANEAIVPINISAQDSLPTQPHTYTITTAPAYFSKTLTSTDPGTWRYQNFVLILTDGSTGAVIPNAPLVITSPEPTYTKLFDSAGDEQESPMIVQTNQYGQFVLKLGYYTQADFSVDPVTKLQYAGDIVVTYNSTIKTIPFEVQ